MTYTLYNRLGSGGFAVEAALVYAAADHRLELVESAPSTPMPEHFRAINPWNQVPALVTQDGTLITETGAILIWLAGRHPALGPEPFSDDHGAFVRWIVFLSVNIYEGVLRQTYPERFGSEETAKIVGRAARDRNQQAYELIEAALEGRETLVGDTISAADIYVAMLTAWHRDLSALPRVEALAERVAGHPAIAPIWQKNFDHRLDRKWGR
ncbi:MAG: glutathione S-transferase family protein [Pseudomonadota bacterium]